MFIGKTQDDVQNDLKMSQKNISAFECGRNDSAVILMWYILKGMTWKFIFESGKFVNE